MAAAGNEASKVRYMAIFTTSYFYGNRNVTEKVFLKLRIVTEKSVQNVTET